MKKRTENSGARGCTGVGSISSLLCCGSFFSLLQKPATSLGATSASCRLSELRTSIVPVCSKLKVSLKTVMKNYPLNTQLTKVFSLSYFFFSVAKILTQWKPRSTSLWLYFNFSPTLSQTQVHKHSENNFSGKLYHSNVHFMINCINSWTFVILVSFVV